MNYSKDKVEVAPYIYVYENVIDNSKEIIDLAKNSEEGFTKAQIYNSDSSQSEENNIRDTYVKYFPPSFALDYRWFLLGQKIWQYANTYAIENRTSFSSMEHIQFLNYQPGEGFYKPHVDFTPFSPRIISSILYLNDVEIGGETYFNKYDVSVTPKSGRMVLFPSNFAYPHEARMPISEEKNVIITFFTT